MEKLDRTATAFGMEISAEKTKLMTNNTSGIGNDIMIGDQKLEIVNKFKYLGAIMTDEGSKPEILSSIAMIITANDKAEDSLDRQKYLSQLKDRESWTLTVDLVRRIQATEMRCF